MDTKLLKQKILDLAIHGKLVPQNPNDEPASKLLEKIREEKQKLIAEKKIKADKNDSYIFVGDDNRHYEKFVDGTVKDIEDEIPFEVPEGWAWCRLGNVCYFQNGYAFSSKSFDIKGSTRVIRISDIKEGTINLNNCIFSSEINIDTSFKAKRGDLLIAMSGATTGKNGVFESDEEAYINQRVGNIKIINDNLITEKYRNMFITYKEEEILKDAYGGAQPNISGAKICDMYLPLPPLHEQKRIVSELEKLLQLVDSLENNKSDLQVVIKHAKSKILDLAIHGKLVPQDSSDEPASVLLEKLRAEKEAKIKAGELKRDKNDSYIYKSTTDNCYYEKFTDGTEEQVELPATVPNSWVWCHFGDVADVINGKNQSKVEDETGIYPIYGSGGIMGRANDYICPENCTIIGRKGSINNPIFVEEKFWNVDTAFSLAPSTGVLPKYLFYFCKSFDFTLLDSSTTLPSLTKTNIQQILFPLPSLSEQHRILNKVESIFKKLDEITLNLI